jgi:hypothetical protein
MSSLQKFMADHSVERRAFVAGLLGVFVVDGCVAVPPVTVNPTSGPTLTPAQLAAINSANEMQAEADLANGIFQIAAAADPTLAPDAALAAKADTLIDSLVPQYVADIEAGSVPTATLLAQISADLSQILQITANHPATDAAYKQAKAKRLGVKG